MWHRREVRRIRLDQQTFRGNVSGDVPELLRFREGQDAGEADISAQLERLLRQGPAGAEAM